MNPSPWGDHCKEDQSEEHVVALLWWALKRDMFIRVLHGTWNLSLEVHWIDLRPLSTISVVVGMFLLYALKCCYLPWCVGSILNPNFWVWSEHTMVSIDYCILVLSICQRNKPLSEEPHLDYCLNTQLKFEVSRLWIGLIVVWVIQFSKCMSMDFSMHIDFSKCEGTM